jgi:hypothetical protein
VILVSSLITKSYFLRDVPHDDKIVKDALETLAKGGSCIGFPEVA